MWKHGVIHKTGNDGSEIIAKLDEDQATTTCNMYRKFCEIWTCGFSCMITDRQTNRQADRQADRQTYKHAYRNISHPEVVTKILNGKPMNARSAREKYEKCEWTWMVKRWVFLCRTSSSTKMIVLGRRLQAAKRWQVRWGLTGRLPVPAASTSRSSLCGGSFTTGQSWNTSVRSSPTTLPAMTWTVGWTLRLYVVLKIGREPLASS